MKAWLLILMLTAGVIIGIAGCDTAMGKEGPARTNQAKDLFAQFGWSMVGDPVESSDTLPADFKLRSGQFPWRVYLDLSSDVGLDFSPLAGARVKTLRFRVQDSQGDRLKEIRNGHLLWGVALLDQEQKVVGAWLTYTDEQGNFEPGIPGYSLRAKSLEQVSGLTWREYSQKYSDKE